jgi:hypothetical protein
MKKLIQLLSLLFIFTLAVKADSPLTSTPFYTKYLDIELVKYASEKSLDDKLMEYLGSSTGDPITKIAIINALSWGKKEYVTLFENYLIKNRKGVKKNVFDYMRTVSDETPEETDDTYLLTADDIMCWAYLQTMGDYFAPAKGMKAGYFCFTRNPKSMAHSVVFTLIATQKAFDEDRCRVYLIPKRMLLETEYSVNILKPEAIKVILDYTELYKSECK